MEAFLKHTETRLVPIKFAYNREDSQIYALKKKITMVMCVTIKVHLQKKKTNQKNVTTGHNNREQ